MNAQDTNETFHYRRKQGMREIIPVREITPVTIRYRRKQ